MLLISSQLFMFKCVGLHLVYSMQRDIRQQKPLRTRRLSYCSVLHPEFLFIMGSTVVSCNKHKHCFKLAFNLPLIILPNLP